MSKSKRKNTSSKLTKRIGWVIGVITLSLLLYIGYMYGRHLKRFEIAHATHYPAFGIDIPDGFLIHGIDVSKHQDEIAWDEVKKMNINGVKVNFVYIKATEGLESVDTNFRINWLNAGRQSISRGAYHFFIATKKGKLQAQNFIKTVKLQPGDLPPVLDIEEVYTANPDSMIAEIKDWLITVENEYGVRPIIYSYANFYEKYLAGSFDDYPLWVAHYLESRGPRIGRDWVFWQHSEEGHINGITSPVDFNVFNGDSTDFEKLKLK